MINKFTGDWDFLSNFHSWQTNYEGIMYPTAEHAFQAAKTLDTDTQVWIYQAKTASIAKQRGRSVSLRPNWESRKVSIMTTVVRNKFLWNKERKFLLLATAMEELVEGNYWHDQYWGNCVCVKRKACMSPGSNMLGLILMKVRREVQSEFFPR